MIRTYARRRDPSRFSYNHPEKGVQHVMHVRSLEKKGLVRAGKQYTHEQDFHLTADGRACVEALWTAKREQLAGETK